MVVKNWKNDSTGSQLQSVLPTSKEQGMDYQTDGRLTTTTRERETETEMSSGCKRGILLHLIIGRGRERGERILHCGLHLSCACNLNEDEEEEDIGVYDNG